MWCLKQGSYSSLAANRNLLEVLGVVTQHMQVDRMCRAEAAITIKQNKK